eukprot:m.241186 g.241186  ORF g.241186 m.241186 type:complete len:244 (+) comp54417_c0_seq7:228-959(+)
MENLHELGFHLIAAACTNTSEGWRFPADAPRVLRMMDAVKSDLGWRSVPAFALGASSGSSMIGRLIAHSPEPLFTAVALFVPNFSAIGPYFRPETLVPAVVVQMPHDPFTLARVNDEYFELMRTNNVHMEVLVATEHPFDVTHIASKCQQLPRVLVQKLFDFFRQHDLIDERNFFKADSRRSFDLWAPYFADELLKMGHSNPTSAFLSIIYALLDLGGQHCLSGQFHANVALFLHHYALESSE